MPAVLVDPENKRTNKLSPQGEPNHENEKQDFTVDIPVHFSRAGAIAFGVTVMLVLTLSELPSASAIDEQDQRTDLRRAAQHRVKKRKKENRQRLVHYVCPMHPDIRSKSHGTCPKCSMDLVAEKRGAKAVRH